MKKMPFPGTDSLNCSFPYTDTSNCTQTFADYCGDSLLYANIITAIGSVLLFCLLIQRLLVLIKFKLRNQSRYSEIFQNLIELMIIQVSVIFFVADPGGNRGVILPYISLSSLVLATLVSISSATDICMRWIRIISDCRLSKQRILLILIFLRGTKLLGIFVPFLMYWIPVLDNSLLKPCVFWSLISLLASIEIPFLVCIFCGIHIYIQLSPSRSIQKISGDSNKNKNDASGNSSNKTRKAATNSRRKVGYNIIYLMFFITATFYVVGSNIIKSLESTYEYTALDPSIEGNGHVVDEMIFIGVLVPLILLAGSVYGLNTSGALRLQTNKTTSSGGRKGQIIMQRDRKQVIKAFFRKVSPIKMQALREEQISPEVL